ncbi:WEB family protein At1g75720-like [Actinidia eriantha]|uniref:WEB family protein At1g75720-like n=1 Tax=Actinidia eriantha TaxID=165200 RepID=UPI0025835481|nr:WEB family protein At1g75720-like [Actinidia eriantha]
MEREEGVVVVGRVEIDTRAPFRSVKEAVMLFGERVLAGEVYGNKLKEMQTRASEQGQYQSRFGAVSTELEETKQSLQKAKEEGHAMAYCLKSLKQELEQTKRELHHLKSSSTAREFHKQPSFDPEIEDLKFIENAGEVEFKTEMVREDGLEYFEKKRSVKFASPPSLAQIMASKDVGEVMETIPTSKTKMKRKSLILFIGGLFSKKKGSREGESPKTQGL